MYVTLKEKYTVEYNRDYELDELTKERLFIVIDEKVKSGLLISDICGVYDWRHGEVSFGYKLKNIIKNFQDLYNDIDFSKTLVGFKRKEGSRYGICNYMNLPMVCGQDVESIWYNKDKDMFFFTYHFSSDRHGLQQCLTGIIQDDLDRKFLMQFFGEQTINGERVYIKYINFRTDTRGLSGPDEAISLRGSFPTKSGDYHDFMLDDRKLLFTDNGRFDGEYFDFFKKIITKFKDRELCKPKKYKIKWVPGTGSRYRCYELQTTRGRVIIDRNRTWVDHKLRDLCNKTSENLTY